MGGIGKALFGGGGSKQSSTSGNKAYDFLQGQQSPVLQTGNNAFQQIAALLGVGGDPAAANGAYENFLNSSGFQNQLATGSKAITGNASARGLLNSGSTAKALTSFGQDLGKQSFANYLGQLGGLFTGGQQAATNIAGAGQYGTSTGKSSQQNGIIPGLFG